MKDMYKVVFAIVLLLTVAGCNGDDGKDTTGTRETIPSVVARLCEGAETDIDKMERIYYFVRDEIPFGWVHPQDIPPEEVLSNGKGICMQKTNLLVAMAREAGLEARFHFMYVHKTALEDFLPGFAYKRWPDPFPHTFPEVYLNGKWVSMEATFDEKLHDICGDKKINFAKNDAILGDVSIAFSPDGVKGHQQYVHAEGKDPVYGNDLFSLTQFMHEEVTWWKRMLQPIIFREAQKIMDRLRSER